jgi:hypothetical protein
MELNADLSGNIESGDIAGDTVVEWNQLIHLLGGNPKTTQIKNSTIRVSARTVVREGISSIVRSYGASLEPRDTQRDGELARVIESVASIRASMRAPQAHPAPSQSSKSSTFLIAWGDTQLGKSAGGGIEGVCERFFDAIDRAIVDYKEKVSLGIKFDSVFMPIMGDITEGVAGNYDSQLFTVLLNAADQQLLGLELVTWAVERVRTEIGLPITVAFVNSNHGEMSRLSTRGGGKNMTSASDTVDRVIGEILKKIYAGIKEGPAVTVLVPGGNLVVTHTASGVPVAIAHGHGIGAKAKATTVQQELLIYNHELTKNNGGVPFMPKVWITAHFHHFSVQDIGPYTHIQTPALDGGSEWFTNISGKYSRPGLVTGVIGSHLEGGIDHIRAIWVAETPKRKKITAAQRLLAADFSDRASNYGE